MQFKSFIFDIACYQYSARIVPCRITNRIEKESIVKRLLGLFLVVTPLVSSCEVLQTSKSNEPTVLTGRFEINLLGSEAASISSRTVQSARASYSFDINLTNSIVGYQNQA